MRGFLIFSKFFVMVSWRESCKKLNVERLEHYFNGASNFCSNQFTCGWYVTLQSTVVFKKKKMQWNLFWIFRVIKGDVTKIFKIVTQRVLCSANFHRALYTSLLLMNKIIIEICICPEHPSVNGTFSGLKWYPDNLNTISTDVTPYT